MTSIHWLKMTFSNPLYTKVHSRSSLKLQDGLNRGPERLQLESVQLYHGARILRGRFGRLTLTVQTNTHKHNTLARDSDVPMITL